MKLPSGCAGSTLSWLLAATSMLGTTQAVFPTFDWLKFNNPQPVTIDADGCLEIEAANNMWTVKNTPGTNGVPRVYLLLKEPTADFSTRMDLNCPAPDQPQLEEQYHDQGIYVRFGGDNTDQSATGDLKNAFYRFSLYTDDDADYYNFFVRRIAGTAAPGGSTSKSTKSKDLPTFIEVTRVGSELHFNFGDMWSGEIPIILGDELDAVGLFAAKPGDPQPAPYTAHFSDFSLTGYAGIVGEPHIQTLASKWFDYHGECDLVLAHVPNFLQGKALRIHVRTTGRYTYSFISTAALAIGDDLLEVSGYGDYTLNGVTSANF